MERSPFESRLAIGVVVLIALVLASGILWYRGLRQLATDKDAIARSYQVLGTLESLTAQIRGAEAAQRTFLMTQDSRAFKALDEALGEARRRVAHLQASVGGSDPLAARLPDLSKRVENIAMVLRHTAAVRETEGFEAARSLVEAAVRLRDESIIPVLQRDESVRLQRRIDAADRTSRRVILTGMATGVSAVLAVGLLGWVLVGHITDRTRRERALDKQRRHLGATLSSIADGVITTNEAGQVTFLNDSAELLTGWTRTDANGLPLDHVLALHDRRSGARVDNVALAALAGTRTINGADHVLVARDGRQWLLSSSAAPIPGGQGQIAGAVLVFRAVQDAPTPVGPVALPPTTPPAVLLPPSATGNDAALPEPVPAAARFPQWGLLGDFARRLASASTLDGVLQVASDQARALVGSRMAFATWTPVDPTSANVTRASAIETDEARAAEDATLTPAVRAARPGWLGVALQGSDQRTLGLLEVCERDDPPFGPHDEVAVVQLGALTSAALERVQTLGQLQRLEHQRAALLRDLASERTHAQAQAADFARQREALVREFGERESSVDEQVARLAQERDELQRALAAERAQPLPAPVVVAAPAAPPVTPGTAVDPFPELASLMARVAPGTQREPELVPQAPSTSTWTPDHVHAVPSAPVAFPAPSGRPLPLVLPVGAPLQRILIVDPDASAHERLALSLTVGGHDVRHATSALEALAVARQFEPTVMLLDASLQGLTCGDLARRARQEAWGSQVVLVAMRSPFGDKVADPVFDQQVTKPVDVAAWQSSLAPAHSW